MPKHSASVIPSLRSLEAAQREARVFYWCADKNQCDLSRVMEEHLGKGAFLKFDDLALMMVEAMDHAPELVIIDCLALDSWHLNEISRLRMDRATQDIPILLRVKHLTHAVVSQCMYHGASDIISRDCLMAQTLLHIETLLQSHGHALHISRALPRPILLGGQSEVASAGLIPSQSQVKALGQIYGLDIDSRFIPCDLQGGDLWGMMPIDDQRLAVYCADFCGHGAHIAPHTQRLCGLLASDGFDKSEPSEVLSYLNKRLRVMLSQGQFCALFYGVIDLSQDKLRFSCASIPAQLFKSSCEDVYKPIESRGLPLGFVQEAEFDTVEIEFAPGAGLLLYSDALVETPMPPNSIFTEQSLAVFLNRNQALCPSQQIVANIQSRLQLDRHRLQDDLTVVSIIRQ